MVDLNIGYKTPKPATTDHWAHGPCQEGHHPHPRCCRPTFYFRFYCQPRRLILKTSPQVGYYCSAARTADFCAHFSPDFLLRMNLATFGVRMRRQRRPDWKRPSWRPLRPPGVTASVTRQNWASVYCQWKTVELDEAEAVTARTAGRLTAVSTRSVGNSLAMKWFLVISFYLDCCWPLNYWFEARVNLWHEFRDFPPHFEGCWGQAVDCWGWPPPRSRCCPCRSWWTWQVDLSKTTQELESILGGRQFYFLMKLRANGGEMRDETTTNKVSVATSDIALNAINMACEAKSVSGNCWMIVMSSCCSSTKQFSEQIDCRLGTTTWCGGKKLFLDPAAFFKPRKSQQKGLEYPTFYWKWLLFM